MKLYDSGRAPNPRRVKIFLAEKGISIPTEQVDIGKLEHKGEAYSALNPVQQVPALVLDDGFVLTETIAICRYIEELHPEPPLFGTDAFTRALVEMWQRRIEFGLLMQVAAVFRHLHPAMAQMEVPQVSEWGEANKERVLRFLGVLDKELEGQEFICGDTLTVADITGLVGLDFMKPAKLAVPEEFGHVRRWHARLSERPSAKA
ncbi:glutathione S-transferase family protein [Enterovirga sp. CN4-39]|uniref:glutathione S-transferase family protein n=1 Tax=Enterovirga sp. CN4-39 TaxID=3400910 RepID=UPI003C0EAF4D